LIDILLSEISSINEKHTLINQKTGACFNILKIIGKETGEVIICKLLRELLDPHGDHYQGSVYLKLFIERILKIKSFSEHECTSAIVSAEYPIEGGRRIDLFIEIADYKIPIEVKIHAPDQARQCFDYYQLAENSKLYYLTLDGNLPSKESAEGLTEKIENDEITGYEEIRIISFGDEIINWIDCCLALTETIKIAPIREILLQFKDVLKKLTGQMEEDAKMDIVKKITSSAENMKNAIDISKALPEAKTGVMLGLFRELKRLFEDEGRKTYDYNEAAIKKYYSKGSQEYPYLGVKIKHLPNNLIATLSISVGNAALWFGFVFTEMNKQCEFSEYVKKESMKKKHPEIYKDFSNAIFDLALFSNKNFDKEEEFLYWDYLYNDKNELFDFKSFSQPCVDLIDNNKEQAKRIFDKLNGYINEIK